MSWTGGTLCCRLLFLDMPKEIYVLGQGSSCPKTSKRGWVYRIEYAPNNAKTPFLLYETVANDAMRGKFSAEHLLCSDWNNHIKYTKSEWLIPLLKRMVAGEHVDKTEILTAYQFNYGHQSKLRV